MSIAMRKMLVICASLMLLSQLSTSNSLHAQYYDWRDTVTEYPNKGTFYHDKFVGRKTASGEVFDQNKFTAAHWKLKLGTYILVTNQNTGLQVIVKVNDRCPKRGVIDLTHRAATAIGIRGCQPVTIRVLPEGYEQRWAAQDSMFDSVSVKHYPAPKAATPAATVTAGKIPVYSPSNPKGTTYGLYLGTVATHGQAYGMTEHLPEAYREQLLIEPSADGDSLTVTLDVKLTRQQAEQLRKALLPSLPATQIKVYNT